MDSAKTPNTKQDLKQVLGRVLVAAHLMTGNLEHAEQAVLEAIERWSPDEGTEDEFFNDEFFNNVIREAARMDASPEPPERMVPRHYLPDELKAVLRLEPQLRSCFVLRNLAGLPSRDCAGLLRLLPGEIDEHNVCALRLLALS